MAAYAMLKHRDPRCFYHPVFGVQYTSDERDESDEVTSHPIERVPSLSGAAADRDIVDVDLHTLEQKVVDDNTAFVVGGLVIEKVRTDVSFYVGCAYCKKRMIVDDHGNLRCERQSMLRRGGHGSFYIADLIRSLYGWSVRRQCKRLFSYERKHADVQTEHFGRDTCVSHH